MRPFSSVSLAVLFSLGFATNSLAQGPSSRPIFSGPPIVQSYGAGAERSMTSVATVVPIPDMFRTEAPFVERNFRIDHVGSGGLHEPVGDETAFFSEISYSFTDRFGVILGAPLISRDNLSEPDATGFGDVNAGVRYVAIGAENEARFKLAWGLNVVAPTGDHDRNLGEGQTFIEPELLMFRKVGERSFVQSQFGLGLPAKGGGSTNEFVWNLGAGHVFTDFATGQLFKFPTTIVELNGLTGLNGEEAGTVLDFTTGLRWSIASRAFGGIGYSIPLTPTKEFESQLILSLIYRYGPAEQQRPDPTSSRAYF